MDWKTFLQWFFIIASGASIFGAFLAWTLRKNGEETRQLLKEPHQQTISILEQVNKTQE